MADGSMVEEGSTRPRRALGRYCTVERAIDLGWFRAEICNYTIPEKFESFALWNVYVLDYSLASRPGASRATYIDKWNGRAPESVGQLLLLPPGHALLATGPAGPQRALHCEIEAEAFTKLGWSPDWTDEALRDSLHLHDVTVERIMARLATELEHADLATRDMCEALARLACIHIARRFTRVAQQRASRSGGLAPWRLRLIEDRACDPTRELPSVTELARLCGLTERHLSRAFRAETGDTIGEYLSDIMTQRARELLESTGEPISAIARSLGYLCPGSFSRAFYRRTGVKPNQVRAQLQSARFARSCARSD